MSDSLCISVTFLDGRFHGQADGGLPEWPPSPLRLFQAIVAANGPSLGNGGDIDAALRWLEHQPPPTLLTPPAQTGALCPLYVPNNAMDLVAKQWVRGNTGASIAEHRTLKNVRPTLLAGGDTVHYVWPLSDAAEGTPPIDALAQAVERMVALGWGIDLVVAQARVLGADQTLAPELEHWEPASGASANALRCAVAGSLDGLMDRHAAFQDRLADGAFHPVPPLTAYRSVGYRRHGDPVGRPTACFELRKPDGSAYTYPVKRLIHVAGMTRCLAIKTMRQSPPSGDLPDGWLESYVAGHRSDAGEDHRQLSFIPLPSIGHRHTDPAVRRVMIVGPVGDKRWVDHLARRLAGLTLVPDPKTGQANGPPAMLVPATPSGTVFQRYHQPSRTWASATPVILPGNDDGKPTKTRKLIRKALEHAGIEQPCSITWHKQSKFPKIPPAGPARRGQRATGFIRPGYLLRYSAVHLTLDFGETARQPGPMLIGAGRHCGLGVMAGGDDHG